MELIITNVIGLLIGLVTSYIFLRYQLSIKPKVAISPVIIYSTERKTFRLKIANESNRQVTDIRAELSIMKWRKYENHALQQIVRRLPLEKAEALVLTNVASLSI